MNNSTRSWFPRLNNTAQSFELSHLCVLHSHLVPMIISLLAREQLARHLVCASCVSRDLIKDFKERTLREISLYVVNAAAISSHREINSLVSTFEQSGN